MVEFSSHHDRGESRFLRESRPAVYQPHARRSANEFVDVPNRARDVSTGVAELVEYHDAIHGVLLTALEAIIGWRYLDAAAT